MSADPIPPDPRKMTDDELCKAWSAVKDHDSLSPLDQAIIDEIARRDLDF